MKCPTCGAWTDTTQTRTSPDSTSIRRTRRCANLHLFFTFETTADNMVPLGTLEVQKAARWGEILDKVHEAKKQGKPSLEIQAALGIGRSDYMRAVVATKERP